MTADGSPVGEPWVTSAKGPLTYPDADGRTRTLTCPACGAVQPLTLLLWPDGTTLIACIHGHRWTPAPEFVAALQDDIRRAGFDPAG